MVSIAPSGHLLVDVRPSEGSAADVVVPFARGVGHGILHLALEHLNAPLPPALVWLRELGRTFLTLACAIHDLEAQRDRLRVPAPGDELRALADAAPPMPGSEYIDATVLERWWQELEQAFVDELREWDGPVTAFLGAHGSVWNLVGRVCFHLAENKRDEERPFAFLATYSTRVSAKAKVQHAPLGQAVRESGSAADKRALLALLLPVERAAKESALVREMYESGELWEPLAWTPKEAHRFLKEVPRLEATGIVVRVPDWWKKRPRPQVAVRIGENSPSRVGLDALLDFKVGITLDGEELSEAEWRALRASSGLQLVRGRWVEIDRERLDQLLAHWKTAQRGARDGLTFIEGMRLLAGAQMEAEARTADPTRDWSQVIAGGWLADTLRELREPAPVQDGRLRAELRPYQQIGAGWLRHLSTLGLGACLADDMGLGKTIQVLALIAALDAPQRTHLLVVPASLIANWQREIERFAPRLRVVIAHGSQPPSQPTEETDLVITTYGTLSRLPWFLERTWDLVILDEAQAIKNAAAKQTRACKQLRARARIALTGTPVENRLGDLWSIFDFLNPGLLGSAKTFAAFTKKLAATGDFAPLRRLVQPYILRRLKSDRRIIADLPDKTEVAAYCALTKAQAALYQQAVDDLRAQLAAKREGIERRGAILASLLRLKQICNHPSHWLRDESWAANASGKFARLAELCDSIAAKQEKVLVFSQFRETSEPLARFLADVFEREGLVLHGGTAVKDRQRLVDRFQNDENVPFFVLSVKAGGTGLNLTAASHVIHFDRWWNPAVENQATDRAYRIGQHKNVLVHKLICRGTVEERIDELIDSKKSLSREILEGGGETLLTELDDAELLRVVSLDIDRALPES
jgi:superfamily II DNA or RNA helicase